jgi:hypothetical protein
MTSPQAISEALKATREEVDPLLELKLDLPEEVEPRIQLTAATKCKSLISGPTSRVSEWAALLMAAAIPCAVTGPRSRDGGPADTAELWVSTEDAAEAAMRLPPVPRSRRSA